MKKAILTSLLTIFFSSLCFAAINPNDPVLEQHARRQEILQNNINSFLQAQVDGESEASRDSLSKIRRNLLSLERFGYELKIDPSQKSDSELEEEILVAMSGGQQVRWNIHGCLTALFISCGLSVGKVPEIIVNQSNQPVLSVEDRPPILRSTY